MVLENMGLPDPYDPNTTLSSNNDIVMHNDGNVDIDDFGDRYEGYQQLDGQEDIPANDSDSDSDVDSNDENVQAMDTAADAQEGGSNLPSIENAENALLKEVWAETQSKDIEMGLEKVQAVKNAMLNFTLPASSIPDWASNIPEQEWKDHMLQKIQSKISK